MTSVNEMNAYERGKQETKEKIKELIAMSSFDISPGGEVSEKHMSIEQYSHELITDIDKHI